MVNLRTSWVVRQAHHERMLVDERVLVDKRMVQERMVQERMVQERMLLLVLTLYRLCYAGV